MHMAIASALRLVDNDLDDLLGRVAPRLEVAL
jgi:UDP-galactopyranose mutase